MLYDSDRKLSPEDLAFVEQVRDYSKTLGLYFEIYINPIIHNGALIVYIREATHQKVFEGPRNDQLMEQVRGYFEGFLLGRRSGYDQGRRGVQSEMRSLLGIEEDGDRVYISR